VKVGPRVKCTFRWSCLFTLVLLAQSPASAQSSQIPKIVRELRAIPLGEPISTDVSPTARSLLKRLKKELRDLTEAVLNGQPAATPDTFRKALLAKFQASGFGLEVSGEAGGDSTQEDDGYGYLEDVTVRQPSGKLLAVVITLQIPCGSDSSLYLFEQRGASWKPVLADEANDYSTVAGAQGSFQYAVSPPDGDRGWFVVAGDVSPWCGSNWQALRYKVMRPGDSFDHPQTLLSRQEEIYVGRGESFKLSVSGDGFQISQWGSQSLDADILTRVHVHKFTVAGSQVSRVRPLALLPQDFLDEWVELPWEEASHWVASTNPSSLQGWQSRLKQNHSGNTRFTTEYDFVQPCPPTGDLSAWQIGLLLRYKGGAEPPADFPDELFFTITRSAGDFAVMAVNTERPPGCPGESKAVQTGDTQQLP
jgi:hypothetical protein